MDFRMEKFAQISVDAYFEAMHEVKEIFKSILQKVTKATK